jgi:hypothetical protein
MLQKKLGMQSSRIYTMSVDSVSRGSDAAISEFSILQSSEIS